ncbi:ABC transporter substrate-binding protein [Nocardioides insulae]|uniref:ABC transporter substrate-binding protein n=1 Tax=Nocardioides insulae TaxID=394734 RepID=UPI00040027CB|nr:ABC transporter substrate-binding protein [Nocardioides insulae]
MLRPARLAAAALLTTAMLSACGGTGGATISEADENLTFSVPLGPRTWDPHPESRVFAYGWYSLVYDGLMSTDASGEIVPGLATKWEHTKDRLSLQLRKGVRFADGTAFDAEAVKWNIEKEQKQPGTAGALQAISRVEVAAPDRVIFHLARPVPDLVWVLSSFSGLMVSPGVSQGELEAGTPAGTGPYTLDMSASQKDTSYTFTPNDKYWEPDVVAFDEVVGEISEDEVARTNALKTGRVDVETSSPRQVKSIEEAGNGLDVVQSLNFIQSFVLLDPGGVSDPVLGEPEVQQAIGHAIDRDAFVAAVNAGYGEPTDQLFSEGPGYIESYEGPEYDPEKARQLLDDAGVDEVTLTAPTWGSFTPGSEALASMLAEVGIDLQLVTVSPGQDIVGVTGGKFTSTYTYIPDRHPHSIYSKYLAENAPYNPFKYVDPEVEQSDAQALEAMGDETAENAAYSTMLDDVYAGRLIPLARYDNLMAFDSDTVSDVEGWAGITGFFYVRGARPVA